MPHESSEWTLLWNDSEVARVQAVGTDTLHFTFSATSTRSSCRTPGYMRGVTVICKLTQAWSDTAIDDWVGGIRQGYVLASSGRINSMPLPGQLNGPLTLSLTLVNGTEIVVTCQTLSALLPTNPEWTESLAC